MVTGYLVCVTTLFFNTYTVLRPSQFESDPPRLGDSYERILEIQAIWDTEKGRGMGKSEKESEVFPDITFLSFSYQVGDSETSTKILKLPIRE